jgi:DNA polymerase I
VGTLIFDDIEVHCQHLLADLLVAEPDFLAVDTETTGLNLFDPETRTIGVSIAAYASGRPYSAYIPFHHASGVNVSDKVSSALRELLTASNFPLVFVNAQFDILALEKLGIIVQERYFVDVPTMAHLINENKPYNKGLDSLAQYYLKDSGKISDPELDKEKKLGWPNTTWEQMWPYAVRDAELTWRLYDMLSKTAEWINLPEGFWEHKQKFIRLLLSMKRHGVRIDQNLAANYVRLGNNEMARIIDELGVNPASPKQLKSLLIDQLGLPILKKSQRTGAPSFDKEAMGMYDQLLESMNNPTAKLIKEFRGWQKAVSASYKPYLELVDHDGRLRCSYKTHGTATGRLSCSEPNLQQIPKTSDKPWNGKVKQCFVADEGFVLINADFSQLELRLATAYAEEEKLKQVFKDGRDIFTEMSKQLGMTRHDTKTLVYSMQYGAGEQRLMSAFGVTKEEAKKIRANYFATYPNFRAFNERCTARVEKTGIIKLWSGRYRHFEDRNQSYKSMNSVIQGGAADIVERIMVKAWEELESDDCRILLQVHDSITFEVREHLADEYIVRIKNLMEDVKSITGDVTFDVKFDVDVGYWADE